jgi:hypothetical protein
MNEAKYGGWRKSSYSGGNGDSAEVAFADWRKSSYSDANGNCVEVASTGAVVGIRDSKQHGGGPVLQFSRGEWDAFIRAVGDGEFDR